MSPRVRQLKLYTSPLLSPLKTSICPRCLHRINQRSISSTPTLRTRLRRDMYRWLDGPGNVFRQPLPNSTNYINAYDQSGGLIRADGAKPSELMNDKGGLRIAEGRSESILENENGAENEDEDAAERPAGVSRQTYRSDDRDSKKGLGVPRETADDLMPFPLNRHFRSQPVLSEELKEEIYKRVMVEGQDVRTVSASLSVEMRRVGAVVRLKAVEKQWESEGKPLAIPYGKAVMSMLPQTPYVPTKPVPHESINDLLVHSATTRQMFHPTSESRHFTRTDAGKVFDQALLPAEKRIPHPELVQIQSWYNEGLHKDEVAQLQRKKIEEEERTRTARERIKEGKERLLVKTKETPRWEFRFRDISVESVGKDGRSRSGVGARYGMPHEDRKKGQIKIPRRVE